MLKKFTFSFLLIIIIFCTTNLLSSCAQTATTSMPEPEYARDITENILQAINSNNYAMYSKDFDQGMKQALTQEVFDQVKSTITKKVGSYEPGSLQFVQAVSQTPYVAVIYSTKFTNETDNVTVTISFHSVEGKYLVGGLYFNSPKLRD
jgi:hypothetical protein